MTAHTVPCKPGVLEKQEPFGSSLVARVKRRRQAEKISLRALARVMGISFSTLARVDRGEGRYSDENARRLRAWLGDDVSQIVSAAERTRAEEIGRLMAHACAAEIQKIISEAL